MIFTTRYNSAVTVIYYYHCQSNHAIISTNERTNERTKASHLISFSGNHPCWNSWSNNDGSPSSWSWPCTQDWSIRRFGNKDWNSRGGHPPSQSRRCSDGKRCAIDRFYRQLAFSRARQGTSRWLRERQAKKGQTRCSRGNYRDRQEERRKIPSKDRNLPQGWPRWRHQKGYHLEVCEWQEDSSCQGEAVDEGRGSRSATEAQYAARNASSDGTGFHRRWFRRWRYSSIKLENNVQRDRGRNGISNEISRLPWQAGQLSPLTSFSGSSSSESQADARSYLPHDAADAAITISTYRDSRWCVFPAAFATRNDFKTINLLPTRFTTETGTPISNFVCCTTPFRFATKWWCQEVHWFFDAFHEFICCSFRGSERTIPLQAFPRPTIQGSSWSLPHAIATAVVWVSHTSGRWKHSPRLIASAKWPKPAFVWISIAAECRTPPGQSSNRRAAPAVWQRH